MDKLVLTSKERLHLSGLVRKAFKVRSDLPILRKARMVGEKLGQLEREYGYDNVTEIIRDIVKQHEASTIPDSSDRFTTSSPGGFN